MIAGIANSLIAGMMGTVPPIVLILTGAFPKVFVNDLLSFSPKGSFNAVLKAFTPESPLKVAILA